MKPRYDHLHEYPQDEFLGHWENFDLWVDRTDDCLVCVRYGDGESDIHALEISAIEDYGIELSNASGDPRGVSALKRAYELACEPPDPSGSANCLKPPSEASG